MKGLNVLDKFIFFLNICFALALLTAYFLPYIPPKTFPTLSVLSLGIGPLLIINFLFFLYWLFKVRRQLFMSLLILLIGFANLSSFYKFSESKKVGDEEHFSVMSYNVKSFNRYNWIDAENLSDSIAHFIAQEQPDILAVQEYFSESSKIDRAFKYKYIKTKTNNSRFGQALFSEFPIINSGSVDFESAGNNAIFIDVVYKKDTLRFYNAHLESLRLKPNVKDLQEEGSERLLGRVGGTFKVQQDQMEQLKAHIETSPYKVIICSDLNNSAFSYVYRAIKGNTFKDAFKMAGNGFGKSFDLDFFPLRIDFILSDKTIPIKGFTTYTKKFSDHFPIKADFNL